MEFTHFDGQGNAHMVDVSRKPDTAREATAKGSIFMSRECLLKVKEGVMAKGDVLGAARIAGIMGAKKTPELIPLCHGLNLCHPGRDRGNPGVLHGQNHREDRGGDGSPYRGKHCPADHLRYVQGGR